MNDRYKIEIDTHTHTVVSGHAFSTLLENAAAAKEKGLYGIVMTEHGPAMPGASPQFHMGIYRTMQTSVNGVRLYRGAECNIVTEDGGVDIESRFLALGDYIMASMHDITFVHRNSRIHTAAMINALKNPYVDALGHPGNPAYENDVEAVVRAARELEKAVEINSHSFIYRKGSAPICCEYIRMAKKYGVHISVGSDAHFAPDVGGVMDALAALEENDFPPELIINRTKGSFEEYLAFRNARRARDIGN